jgi:hypothetical protein
MLSKENLKMSLKLCKDGLGSERLTRVPVQVGQSLRGFAKN